mgnify:CR=1 FL=1
MVGNYVCIHFAFSYLEHQESLSLEPTKETKIRYLSQQRDNISPLMIHISFTFLSLSCLRVTPGRDRGAGVPGPGLSPLWRQKQSRIRHNKTSPEPEPGDINNIIFLLARARITMIEVSVPTLCRGKDRSLVKCPGVQPDRYSIFVLGIYFQNTVDS